MVHEWLEKGLDNFRNLISVGAKIRLFIISSQIIFNTKLFYRIASATYLVFKPYQTTN